MFKQLLLPFDNKKWGKASDAVCLFLLYQVTGRHVESEISPAPLPHVLDGEIGMVALFNLSKFVAL